MSDAHNKHESAIKTPKQLIAAIVAAILVPVVCIYLLVQYVTGEPKVGAGSNAQTPDAIAARIAPVADQGYTFAAAAAAAPQAQTGEPAATGAPAAPATAAPEVAAASAPAPDAAPAGDAGKKLFDTICTTCHTPGIAGAPKFGDKTVWAPRIKQGVATLYDHALKGFQGKSGVMPPKGGSTASDAEVKAAVDYIVANGK